MTLERIIKKINIPQLIEESKAKKVSVYVLIKRKMHYRKVNPYDLGYGECILCGFVEKDVKYKGCSKMQCHIIGIINEVTAYLDDGHTCNFFQRNHK